MIKKLPVVPSAKPGSMSDAPSGIVWREQHPEINGKCNQCLECVLFCPEGALKEDQGQIVLTLDWCNGCGTCAVECPQKAITMLAEFKGNRGIFPLKEGSV